MCVAFAIMGAILLTISSSMDSRALNGLNEIDPTVANRLDAALITRSIVCSTVAGLIVLALLRWNHVINLPVRILCGVALAALATIAAPALGINSLVSVCIFTLLAALLIYLAQSESPQNAQLLAWMHRNDWHEIERTGASSTVRRVERMEGMEQAALIIQKFPHFNFVARRETYGCLIAIAEIHAVPSAGWETTLDNCDAYLGWFIEDESDKEIQAQVGSTLLSGSEVEVFKSVYHAHKVLVAKTNDYSWVQSMATSEFEDYRRACAAAANEMEKHGYFRDQ